MEETPEELADYNRKQLYSGLTSEGRPLSPLYSQDPYFKKPGAAERYAKWKEKNTPDPKRPFDVPNLFINGAFHRSIVMKVVGDVFSFQSSDKNAGSIEAKFSDIYGLTAESKQQYGNEVMQPGLVKRIAQITGCGIGI